MKKTKRSVRSAPYDAICRLHQGVMRPTNFVAGGVFREGETYAQESYEARNEFDQQNQEHLRTKLEPVIEEPPQLDNDQSEETQQRQTEVPFADIKGESLDTVDEAGEPAALDVDAKKTLKKHRIDRIMSKVKPKSATVILNEMYKAPHYDIIFDGHSFQASLQLACGTFVGVGRSKSAAQAAAADMALKQMVLSSDLQVLHNGKCRSPLDHSNLLSYALYKLLNAWDESGAILNRIQAATVTRPVQVVKPSKKFPTNPECLHPVMLLSQTYPMAIFTEIAHTPPPNISFTIQCDVSDKKYFGCGTNKKDAKKRAAIEACKELLGVSYADTKWNTS